MKFPRTGSSVFSAAVTAMQTPVLHHSLVVE